MMKDKVRDAALRFLCDAERDNKYINLALGSALSAFSDRRDKALFTLLVYGITEKSITLDYYISKFSSRPVNELERFTKYILRLGFYQLVFMHTPSHAAVNETVSLARQSGERGFVNAVLRSYLRAPEVELPKKEDGLIPYLSVSYSFPEWMCEGLVHDYGEKCAEEILTALSKKAPLTIRANTLRITRDKLIEKFDGYNARKTEFSPNGIVIEGDAVPTELPEFNNGLYMIQDEASQIAAHLLGATPDSVACDVCAAPGSKSFAIAMDMQNRGKLYSFDIHRSKLPLIEDGAKRLSIDIIEAGLQNAKQPRSKLKRKVDFLLCDVPCSGLGVAAKKPDIRRKSGEDMDEFGKTSYEILNASVSYLKEGGRLVYSTCTLRKDENDNVVLRFLAEHPEFEPEDFTFTAENGTTLSSKNGMLTIFPQITGGDGFFVSRFRKKVASV